MQMIKLVRNVWLSCGTLNFLEHPVLKYAASQISQENFVSGRNAPTCVYASFLSSSHMGLTYGSIHREIASLRAVANPLPQTTRKSGFAGAS